MKQDLSVNSIINTGLKQGLTNALPLLVNALLWGVTIWIPYLNIGTTIGLFSGVIAKAGRGEQISYTEVFNPEYRKYMGNYFLVIGLMSMGIIAATAFFVVPGIVLAIAWSLGVLFVVDKGESPLEALNHSNEATYGKKWTIFGGLLVLGIIVMIVSGIISAIGMKIPVIGFLLPLIAMALSASVMITAQGHIYNTLAE